MKNILNNKAILFIALLASVFFVNTKQAAAVVDLNTGSFPPSFIPNVPNGSPGFLVKYDCKPDGPLPGGVNGAYYQLGSWVSPNNNPQQANTAPATIGQVSVPLQFNRWVFVHHLFASAPGNVQPPCSRASLPTDSAPLASAVLTSNTMQIINSSAVPSSGSGHLVGITPRVTGDRINRSGTSRYWFNNTPIGFSYHHDTPGGLTTTITVTVNLWTKEINTFRGGTPSAVYSCVGVDLNGDGDTVDPGEAGFTASSPTDFGSCPDPVFPHQIVITVVVPNRQQDVSLNAVTACTPTLSGWAIDEDYPNGEVRVALYRTTTYPTGNPRPAGPGVQVNPPGIIDADDATPRINPPYPFNPFPAAERNGHGFTFDISALLPPGGSSRDFYVMSWGFDSARRPDNILAPRVAGPFRVTCNKPTGNISTTCQYVPATAFVINLSNINDADNPSTSLRIRVRLDWGTPGQRVIAAGPVDGTTDSLQILDGAAFLGGTHTVDVRVYGVNVAGTEDGGDYDIPTHTSARGCQVSCDTSGTSGPSEPDSMTPTNIRVNIHNYGPTPTNGPLQVTVTYPAGYPAPYNGTLPAPLNGAVGLVPPNFPGSIAPNGLGTYNGSFVHGPSGKPMGVYRISATYNGVNYPNCGSFVIGYLPYVRAYGGDIFAGSNDGRADDNTVNTVCQGWGLRNDTASTNVNDNTTAGIYGFPGTLSASQRTAAQLGVFALGEIHNVSSSVINGGAPRRLAFANTGAGIPPEGQLAVSHCPNDYWGNAQPATTATVVGAAPVLDSLSGNALDRYYHNGAVSLSAQTINGRSGVCTNPKTVNLFVRGNVTITGDIKYQNGTCPGPGKIPRLQIVATGSINIASNVTVLDGVYIAQDYPFCGGRPCGGSNGTIYTCTRSNGARIDESGSGNPNLYRDCSNQLTVNGALIATRIKWLRTFGTLRESQGTSEYPGSATAAPCPSASDNRPAGTRSSNTPGVGSSCASEIINLTPEAYIVSTPSSTRQIDTNFDVITSLPPLL